VRCGSGATEAAIRPAAVSEAGCFSAGEAPLRAGARRCGGSAADGSPSAENPAPVVEVAASIRDTVPLRRWRSLRMFPTVALVWGPAPVKYRTRESSFCCAAAAASASRFSTDSRRIEA
jgi:hypothetical protein